MLGFKWGGWTWQHLDDTNICELWFLCSEEYKICILRSLTTDRHWTLATCHITDPHIWFFSLPPTYTAGKELWSMAQSCLRFKVCLLWAEDVLPLVRCLSSMHEVLGSSPNTTYNWWGHSHPQSQHIKGRHLNSPLAIQFGASTAYRRPLSERQKVMFDGLMIDLRLS